MDQPAEMSPPQAHFRLPAFCFPTRNAPHHQISRFRPLKYRAALHEVLEKMGVLHFSLEAANASHRSDRETDPRKTKAATIARYGF